MTLMTKIVLNRCYGGFGLSDEAIALIAARKRATLDYFKDGDVFIMPDGSRVEGISLKYELPRTDPDMIAVLEEIGSERCSGDHAELGIVYLRPGTRYRINEYDGVESILTEADLDLVA